MDEIIDFSDVQAWVRVWFQVLGEGWGWNHPRVTTWMERVGCPDRHHLSFRQYQILEGHLRKLAQETKAVTPEYQEVGR